MICLSLEAVLDELAKAPVAIPELAVHVVLEAKFELIGDEQKEMAKN